MLTIARGLSFTEATDLGLAKF